MYKISHSISNIEWLNVTKENGAWVYIGNGDEIRKDFIFKCIDEHFTADSLYISLTRNGSKEATKSGIESAIGDILGVANFSIWDADFERVIEFNKNGIMRLGKKQSSSLPDTSN